MQRTRFKRVENESFRIKREKKNSRTFYRINSCFDVPIFCKVQFVYFQQVRGARGGDSVPEWKAILTLSTHVGFSAILYYMLV